MIRFTTLLAACLLLSLSVAPVASAESARPTILQAAEQQHEAEQLEGGEVTLAACHPGRQRATVVCDVGLSGTIWKSGELLEAKCSLAIAGIWRRIMVENFAAGGGYWTAQPVSVTACEGSSIGV